MTSGFFSCDGFKRKTMWNCWLSIPIRWMRKNFFRIQKNAKFEPSNYLSFTGRFFSLYLNEYTDNSQIKMMVN